MGLVRSVNVTNTGSGYIVAPQVVIVGDGTGALAIAHLVGSVVGRIQVLMAGTGYTNATAVITTAPGDTGGGARATVSIAPTYEEHLLPYNATILEQCLSAVSDVITKIPVPIEQVWRPDECPEPLLPWLAWALSVDDWDNSWSEATRRQAIKDSIPHHRKKGTRSALDAAVAPYLNAFTFQEWWEYGSAAYHYRFRGKMPPVTWPDLTLVNKMWDASIRAKNVRSYPDPILVEAETNPASVYITPFYRANMKMTLRPAGVERVDAPPTSLVVAAVPRITTIVRIGMA